MASFMVSMVETIRFQSKESIASTVETFLIEQYSEKQIYMFCCGFLPFQDIFITFALVFEMSDCIRVTNNCK